MEVEQCDVSDSCGGERDLSDLLFVAQAVEGLLDATSGADADLLLRYRECHLLVLKALQDGRAYGPQWCNKQITR